MPTWIAKHTAAFTRVRVSLVYMCVCLMQICVQDMETSGVSSSDLVTELLAVLILWHLALWLSGSGSLSLSLLPLCSLGDENDARWNVTGLCWSVPQTEAYISSRCNWSPSVQYAPLWDFDTWSTGLKWVWFVGVANINSGFIAIVASVLHRETK